MDNSFHSDNSICPVNVIVPALKFFKLHSEVAKSNAPPL